MLYTDRFGRRAYVMFASTAAEFAAEVTAETFSSTGIFILLSGDVVLHHPLGQRPPVLAPSFRTPFISFEGLGKLPPALTTPKRQPVGGVERVNRSMAQMLAANDRQRTPKQLNWDVEFTYCCIQQQFCPPRHGFGSQRGPCGLAAAPPSHDFRFSSVLESPSLARDHLAYCDLATDRQQRAHDIVSQTPRPPRCLLA